MTRLLLVEDHAVVRTGLQHLFAAVADIDVVAAASNGEEGIELTRRLKPDVVLMDLVMPGVDGRAATRRIVSERPETRVVVLTSFSDREQILAALDAGAVGYLLKDADPDELIAGVRSAAAGESPLAPPAASAVVAARHGSRPAERLSPRERDVLALIAEGLPNKRIAQRLEISEKTVKAHVTRVFTIVGVTDRTQAALWARERGVVF